MRALGPKRTMLAGVLFGLNAFGIAFAHGSLWLTFVWMALNGVPAALAGSGSYALAAEAVAPEQGILVSTIYNIAAGTGCTIASAAAGYVLTLRQVPVPVSTPNGVQNQLFPANATITWAALIAAGMAVAGVIAVSSITTGRLRVQGAREAEPMAATE